MESKNPRLKTPEQALKAGLYAPLDYETEDELNAAANLELFAGPYDEYCIQCGRVSVFDNNFKRSTQSRPDGNRIVHIHRDSVFEIKLFCSRRIDHELIFIFRTEGKSLQKIGQYPSNASLLIPQIQVYKKLLSSYHAELSRAIGLHAHGIGIGSFAYLRRVFELLVEEAHKNALSGNGWDEEEYGKSRMSEKIVMLKQYLPDYLVSNSQIYGVLSKGLHELEEEECKEYFPVMLGSIELILDQKLAAIERQNREKAITQSVTDISSKILKKSSGNN